MRTRYWVWMPDEGRWVEPLKCEGRSGWRGWLFAIVPGQQVTERAPEWRWTMSPVEPAPIPLWLQHIMESGRPLTSIDFEESA